MKNFFTILMILASSFIPFIAFAQANFVRDLFVGITGGDVFDLQKILNTDPETRIAESGVGSAGAETDYFGNLTKSAVEKFQLKYSDYVLKPVGLALPTGRVGQYTRDFLNNKFSELKENTKKNIEPVVEKIIPAKTETKTIPADFYNITKKEIETAQKSFTDLFNNKASNETNIDKNLFPDLPYFSKQVNVFNTEKFQVAPGDSIAVNGLGFTPQKNNFIFGGFSVKDISCQSSIACTFNLPKNISEGEKEIVVENENGSSKKQQFSVKVKITSSPKSATVLTNITPSEITTNNLDEKITISGTGFAKENYIFLPTGRIGSISSTNNQVSFKIKDFKEMNSFTQKINEFGAKEIKIPIMVQNEYGSSNYLFLKISSN